MLNPCQRCGACCAYFKVPVQESETGDQADGIVPVELTVADRRNQRMMKGTEGFRKRCVALTGTIGLKVTCNIYDRRPSPCREFKGAWEDEEKINTLCNLARGSFGLYPFEG